MGQWVDGSMGRWVDGSMGRWVDGSMGRWVNVPYRKCTVGTDHNQDLQRTSVPSTTPHRTGTAETNHNQSLSCLSRAPPQLSRAHLLYFHF
jgi:hypothetical protein